MSRCASSANADATRRDSTRLPYSPPPALPYMMASDGERSMFFAGSDDEQMDDTQAHSEVDTMEAAHDSVAAATQPRSPTQRPLFFADSDDEEPTNYSHKSALPLPETDADDGDIELDVEMPDFVDVPRASSLSSDASSEPCDKTRQSSPEMVQGKLPKDPVKTEGPPTKRRKVSPPAPSSSAPSGSIYLGYFLVDNAWSTVKGTGYIKPGEEILIERDEVDKPPPPPPKKPAKKGADGKKQLTIANMFKPAPAKPAAKKKQDSVVRITNTRGFGMFVYS